MALANTAGDPVALTVGGNNASTIYAGNLSGNGSLLKLGGGVLTMTGSNSHTGGTTISAGTLQLGDGRTRNGYISGEIVDNATLSFAPATFQTYPGNISGSGGLTKAGGGIAALSGSNTYTGGTMISGGALRADFSRPGAPQTNIINSATNSSSLTLAGGVLIIQGSAGAANSQSFNGLTVNPGISAIVLTAAASNSVVLHLGDIQQVIGGAVDFILPAGPQSATNGITTTTPNTGGILGGYATVNESDWAAVSGAAGNIIAFTDYTNGDLGVLPSNAALNVLPTGQQSSVDSAKTFNSLKLTGTVGVSMSDSGSLALLSGGLIGNTSGMISGGTLGGSPSGELVVSTPRNLAISSVIDATKLTKAGTGTLAVYNLNGSSGTTVISSGALLLALPDVAQYTEVHVNVDNGLQFDGAYNSFSVSSIAGTGALELKNTAGSAVTMVVGGNNASTTYGGVISGPGGVVHSGSGTLELAAANTFGGGLVLESNITTFVSPTSGGTGTITVDGSSTTTFTADMPIPNDFDVQNSLLADTQQYTVTFSGTISGPGGLTKYGTGTLVLAGSNTISGLTNISQGTLQLSNSAALPNCTVNVDSHGSLAFGASVGTVEVGGLSGSGALKLSDTGNVPVNLVVGKDNQNTTYGGTISGPGSLTKAGDASLDLEGQNGWTGGLYFDPGTVAFRSDSALGGPTNPIVFLGSGTLQSLDSTMLLSSRTISISAGATAAFDPSGNTLEVAGPIRGQGALALVGSGTLLLSNTDTYSGGTFVSNGTLEAMTSSSLPGAPNCSSVHVSGGATLVLAVGGSQQWMATMVESLLDHAQFSPGANFSLDASGGSFDVGPITASRLSLAIATGTTLAVGGTGNSIFGGRITGGGALRKLGSGTLVLSPGATDNDYLGGTDVLDGTLVIASIGALGDGTDLNIGEPSSFAPFLPASTVAADSGLNEGAIAVPEPESLALIVTSTIMLISGAFLVIRPRKRSAAAANVNLSRSAEPDRPWRFP